MRHMSHCAGRRQGFTPRAHLACLQGGIVGKERQFRQKGKPFLLTVEDPQQPGTDIGSGAFNISQVASPTRETLCMCSEAPDAFAVDVPRGCF